ncbi:cell wall metabolism sensor histidine kinase WalK [Fusibacter sp. 3D3]|uniref:sensor histidine kinase n=1 Tax=Fusibacter sp. 3D3 TaxID=1048380 RepID=UPI000858F42A|nr:sensor histidine kinase [Fusibacter sp. 3D3]GAU77108.1 sensory transduction protein kinase [Fusibacter sp. 3D3]
MMTALIFLSILWIATLIVALRQYSQRKSIEKDLLYITSKLEMIMEGDEMIRLFTDNPTVIELQKQINQNLEIIRRIRANEHHNEANMKRMLSNVSHDLKTPLTVISGYLEMLLKDENLEIREQKRILERVHSKSIEIINIVNYFFDLAKIESEDYPIPLVPVDLHEICKQNILHFYSLFQKNNLEVSIDIPDTPNVIHSNVDALNRILNNLISNAIRYGYEGGIVGIKVKTDDSFVTLTIWDKGKGIKEQHLNQVFERLYTLEDSRNKNYQSSGIGLTITKRLVERLGGEILLKSVPYELTQFMIKLKK